MANSLATQILVDGARNAIVKVVGNVDTSDYSPTDIVVPSDFTPTPTTFAIDRLIYAVEDGITVRLWWDATTDVYIVTLDGTTTMDFRRFGGLQNNAAASGFTGKIQLSTEGYTSGTQAFTVVLEMSKIGV